MRAIFSAQIARKAFDRLTTKAQGLPLWLSDRRRSTYSEAHQVPTGSLRRFLNEPQQPPADRAQILALAEHFLRHEFDLYGSGWKVSVLATQDNPLPQFAETRANVLRERIQKGYTPLGWHSDLQSGYTWPAATWFQHVRKVRPGADVRRPWELARCHHWQVLARAYGFTGERRFLTEIENQFYDFVAQNPPRYGVNWSSTMDVAIRASNWLLAWDIAQALGGEFSAGFAADFKRAIYEHAHHIFHHLESSASDRANHYLANIAGLACVAAYLPGSEKWFDFAHQELIHEAQFQFLPDGGSFEGSTNYHRLSAEMLIYASAILHAQGAELPTSLLLVIQGAVAFSVGIEKPSGQTPQIGDNDSGRFLKLNPRLDASGEHEDPLNHQHLAQATRAFFSEPAPHPSFEEEVVRQLLRKKIFRLQRSVSRNNLDSTALEQFAQDYSQAKEEHRQSYSFRLPKNLNLKTLRSGYWPDFGLYVIKNADFYLSIRCDARSHRSMEGHAHNDLFAIDLQCSGIDILRDPGSFTYYPDPSARNRYRSIAQHFPSQLLLEEANESFSGMLFTFNGRLAGRCLYFSSQGFVGRCETSSLQLAVTVLSDQVWVRAISRSELSVRARQISDVIFSPGYGRQSEGHSYVSTFLVDSHQ